MRKQKLFAVGKQLFGWHYFTIKNFTIYLGNIVTIYHANDLYSIYDHSHYGKWLVVIHFLNLEYSSANGWRMCK